MGIFATKSQACEFSFHQISLCIFPSDIYTACIDLLPVKLVRWVLSEARMTVRIVVPILRQAYWGLSCISSCMTMYPYSLAAWTTHVPCTSHGRHGHRVCLGQSPLQVHSPCLPQDWTTRIGNEHIPQYLNSRVSVALLVHPV